MQSYLVIKRVALQVGSKTYRKDAVITAEMVGQDKINRYLARKYIMPVGVVALPSDDEQTNNNDLPFYLTTDEFLTDEEVLVLERQDLLKYAKHIGMEFNSGIQTKRLQPLVIQFIEDALKIPDDGNDGNSDNDSDDENNQNENGDAEGLNSGVDNAKENA